MYGEPPLLGINRNGQNIFSSFLEQSRNVFGYCRKLICMDISGCNWDMQGDIWEWPGMEDAPRLPLDAISDVPVTFSTTSGLHFYHSFAGNNFQRGSEFAMEKDSGSSLTMFLSH